MQSQIVPFGKYKDQPIEMLIGDTQYLNWILAQSWFAEKYQPIYNFITTNIQEPSETPEHNKFQSKFLDTSYRLALGNLVVTLHEALYCKPLKVAESTKVVFEEMGFDVIFNYSYSQQYEIQEKERGEWVEAWENRFLDIVCELKPTLSDDYPAVIRQMKKAMEVLKKRNNFNTLSIFVIVVGEYTGVGADWKDVVEMFKSSGILAILESEY